MGLFADDPAPEGKVDTAQLDAVLDQIVTQHNTIRGCIIGIASDAYTLRQAMLISRHFHRETGLYYVQVDLDGGLFSVPHVPGDDIDCEFYVPTPVYDRTTFYGGEMF